MTDYGMPAFAGVFAQKTLDPPDARLHAAVFGVARRAFQFVGQISEQIGRAHLRKDQVYERSVGFAQHTAEHGHDERLARARRPGQKRPAAAIFHCIAQLQQRVLEAIRRGNKTSGRRSSQTASRRVASRFRTWGQGSGFRICGS